MENETSDIWFESFDVHRVVLPIREGHGVASHLNFGAIPIHVVIGRTNQGGHALGEAFRADDSETVNRTLRSLIGAPLNRIHPATVWMKDTFETGFVGGMTRTKRLPSWEVPDGRSIALLESLWLDAMGKSLGVPAYGLLGGAVRDSVRVDYWASQPNTKELVRLVEIAQKAGCTGMKLKSDREGNTVWSLKEIAGDLPSGFQFTIDPMFNWRSLHESRRIFRALEKLEVPVRIEDPFPFEALDDWRLARSQYPLTLIWHTRGEEDLRISLRENVADAFNVACRCAHEAVRLAEVIAFHGKDCWFGSQLETGIFQQVRLHSASVAPTCVMACDLQSQWVREETLIAQPMTTDSGNVNVGALPGLGVEIDQGVLSRHTLESWSVAGR